MVVPCHVSTFLPAREAPATRVLFSLRVRYAEAALHERCELPPAVLQAGALRAQARHKCHIDRGEERVMRPEPSSEHFTSQREKSASMPASRECRAQA